jgi:hypothetical protein
MVEWILGRATDISAADNDGVTPLEVAADKGYSAIVNLLLGSCVDRGDVLEITKFARLK